MSETTCEINKFKLYSFIDLVKTKTVDLNEIINDNYTSSNSDYFYVIFFFSASWLPDSSNMLADELKSFYQAEKNKFRNFDLIFISSDKSFTEYKSFVKRNSFLRYTLDFLDHNTKSQLIKYFGIQSLPFVGIVRFELDKQLKLIAMHSEKKNEKNNFLSNQLEFPWFIEQKSQKLNENSRFLDEILANMNPIRHRTTKENFETIKSNNLFLFILFMSNQVIARKQIIKSFIEFDKDISKSYKFLFLFIDLNNYECKELHNTNWFTIKKSYFKLKIMHHFGVEFVPRLLVLDLATGNLLNTRIMCKMTEYYYEIIRSNFESIHYYNDHLVERKFLCPDTFLKLKENIVDICTNEKEDNGSRVLFLLYFCSYNTAVKTMESFDEITKFLAQMPKLKKYLLKIVLVSSDPTKESYFNLINELKSKKNPMLNLSALSFESNEIKQNLLKNLQIITIPWFSLIDSIKGLVLCENVKSFFQQNNSNHI